MHQKPPRKTGNGRRNKNVWWKKHLKNKQRTKFPKQQEKMVYKKNSRTSVDFEMDKANSSATISAINESTYKRNPYKQC
jgi:hypothetical protein